MIQLAVHDAAIFRQIFCVYIFAFFEYVLFSRGVLPDTASHPRPYSLPVSASVQVI